MKIVSFIAFSLSLTCASASASDYKPTKRMREEAPASDSYLEGILKNQSMLLAAHVHVAEKYFSFKDYKRASEIYHSLALNSIAHMRNAVVAHRMSGNHDYAIELGKQICESNDCTVDDDLELATLYYLKSKFIESFTLYNKIPLELISGVANKTRAAMAACSDGHFERAKALFESVIFDEDCTIRDAAWVAKHYRILGDMDNACRIRELILKNPDHSISDMLNAAKYSLLKNDRQRAHEIANAILNHPECTEKIRKYVLVNKQRYPL